MQGSNEPTRTPGVHRQLSKSFVILACVPVVILVAAASRAIVVKSDAPRAEHTQAQTESARATSNVASAPVSLEAAHVSHDGAPLASSSANTGERSSARQRVAKQTQPAAFATPAVAVSSEASSSSTDAAQEDVAPSASPSLSLTPPDVRNVPVAAALAQSPNAWSRIFATPGLVFSAEAITDASSGTNAMTGARASRVHGAFAVAIDFDSLVGWHGATAFVQHKTRRGRDGSANGEFVQAFSNIDADDFSAFGEVWFQQQLLQDKLRIKLGRLDFNAEFAGTDNGADFLNASMGFSPSIAGAPTFPLPSTAVNVVAELPRAWKLSAGVFDGRDGAPSPERGTARFQIAQATHTWELRSPALPGRVAIGGWQHTGMFSLVGTDESEDPTVKGTNGWYATLDQTLWAGAPRAGSEDNRASISAFAQFGRGNRAVQVIQAHEGGGVTLTGLVPARSEDVIGLAVTRAAWFGGRETIGEMYYRLPVLSHLTLVTDVQRVNRFFDDATPQRGNVFTLRTIVSY